MCSKPLIQPVTESDTSVQTAKMLEQIDKTLGNVPKVFRTVAHSRIVLQSLWHQFLAVEEMQLSPRIREGIGIRVAQLNGCDYCLTAHMDLCLQAGVDEATAIGFRDGQSNDPKEQILLALTTKIVKHRGHHAGFVVEMARQLGVSDAEIIEVIALISMNTFLNLVTNVANTDLDDYPSTEKNNTDSLDGEPDCKHQDEL